MMWLKKVKGTNQVLTTSKVCPFPNPLFPPSEGLNFNVNPIDNVPNFEQNSPYSS